MATIQLQPNFVWYNMEVLLEAISSQRWKENNNTSVKLCEYKFQILRTPKKSMNFCPPLGSTFLSCKDEKSLQRYPTCVAQATRLQCKPMEIVLFLWLRPLPENSLFKWKNGQTILSFLEKEQTSEMYWWWLTVNLLRNQLHAPSGTFRSSSLIIGMIIILLICISI